MLHYRPPNMDTETFEGGFVAAISALEQDSALAGLYCFSWINIGLPNEHVNFDAYDVILVKSNWEWGLDQAVRATLDKVRVVSVSVHGA